MTDKILPKGQLEDPLDFGIEGRMETDEIIVTKHGAFKKKKPEAPVIKPQIFKLQRQIGASVGGGKILVYNKDRSWEGELPMTPELSRFFGEDYKKYVIATPDASGKIHIECAIVPDDQF